MRELRAARRMDSVDDGGPPACRSRALRRPASTQQMSNLDIYLNVRRAYCDAGNTSFRWLSRQRSALLAEGHKS
jgi:hypothetical protein